MSFSVRLLPSRSLRSARLPGTARQMDGRGGAAYFGGGGVSRAV